MKIVAVYTDYSGLLKLACTDSSIYSAQPQQTCMSSVITRKQRKLTTSLFTSYSDEMCVDRFLSFY